MFQSSTEKMPRKHQKSTDASSVGSQASRARSLTSSSSSIKLDAVPVSDKRQSLRCLQQQLFIAVSALARGRDWLSERDIDYREAANDLQCPFIRKAVRNCLAAQIRRYIHAACALFERFEELAEFRLLVVLADSMQSIEEIGFVFDHNAHQKGLTAEQAEKVMHLGSIRPIETAREKIIKVNCRILRRRCGITRSN